MISYRFRRRAFLTAMSGGVGLKIMLRNLEGSAAGMRSPGRLLVTHWPVGIVAGKDDALWRPTSGSVGGSPGLKPFADAGLGPDMTVLRGLSTDHLRVPGAGNTEQGVVTLVTGRPPVGTRANCCEGDDAIAAPGGSFEQILLDKVPALRRPGQGYANSIADSRTDFGEVSTRTLSYSTNVQDVTRWGTGAAKVSGAIPLIPVLAPLTQFNSLFSSFMPGSGERPRADAALKRLVGRRSVLDFAAEELNQLRTLGPMASRNKLSIHTEEVLGAESSVANAIRNYPIAGGSTTTTCGGICTTTPSPPPPLPVGKGDPACASPDPAQCRGVGNDFGMGNDQATEDDAAVHAMVGHAHLDILKAAFVCDLLRVGTFQWSPASNHVAFAGLYPGSTAAFMHHPLSHRINTAVTLAGSTPAELNDNAEFLYNVQLWYFMRHSEAFAKWKTQVDGCGNSLLDFTCVPFVTEGAACGHEQTNMPAMIIGGKRLGFLHNRYVTEAMTINQLWGTIAQAFGHPSTDAPFAPPVSGFLAKP
jgi:hypothetical protein